MEVSCTELAIQKFDHDSKMEEPDKYMHVRKEMLIQTPWVGGGFTLEKCTTKVHGGVSESQIRNLDFVLKF